MPAALMNKEDMKQIKCFTCRYHIPELDTNGMLIECMIPRKEQPYMTSSWWISPKYDKWGQREYLRNCPLYWKEMPEEISEMANDIY
jgi:hypothetical protein